MGVSYHDYCNMPADLVDKLLMYYGEIKLKEKEEQDKMNSKVNKNGRT